MPTLRAFESRISHAWWNDYPRISISTFSFHFIASGNGHHSGISLAGALNGRIGASLPYPAHAHILNAVGGVGFSIHRGHLKQVSIVKYRVIVSPAMMTFAARYRIDTFVKFL